MKENMRILNLTQHSASDEQVAAGVVELSKNKKQKLAELLTFGYIPSKEELTNRANEIAEIAHKEGMHAAMIGGAPFFMSHLEDALKVRAIAPLYAFSRRESVEKHLENGEVKKASVFRHLAFIAAK